ncbi:D-alanine--D-alanine ligase [Halonatronum saccharophilum]|uniref:D-alanine--D-alanine ligase n=1 Tax=Halonatronum saccharophilum TaxID=150060 RepID=UPI000483D776|nr:D-alanine--D-alanine ligase [Halonatronum saccharophilum]
MLEDKKIGVIRGGRSAEREISLKTGKAVLNALNARGYKVFDLDPAYNLHSSLRNKDIDLAFIALHGRYGEDGTIQGLLDIEGIPYTGSGVLSSALAIDKVMSKRLFEQQGLATPRFKTLTSKDLERDLLALKEGLIKELELPIVVKPALEGSSIGLSIVHKDEDLITAIKEALKHDVEVLVEEFIEGREITIGILGNEDPQLLPIIEIKPNEGVYDFNAKYTKGMTEFVIPASLDKQVYKKSEDLALQAYKVLRCRGMGRVDLMISKQGEPYLLEVNTIPGMTETSLLPQAAKSAGIDFDQLVAKILEYALD